MNRLIQIFTDAIEISHEAERNQFIKEACAEDLELLVEVQALVNAHFKPGTFLSNPPSSTRHSSVDSVSVSKDEHPGAMIGPFKLLEKLGEGGFGTVWMAEQKEPIKRRVALKIINQGHNTKKVIARFEVERQVLALLEHPNIAKVLDAGETANGRPYFVMELVRGESITDYCKKERLTVQKRIELFLPICQAIQHAHHRGIIHRDLKPSNILVTMRDGTPIPIVIDFGIAKATQQELTEKTLFTLYHEFLGTPEYMSPEQAEYSCLDIDTRTDVYSLGVLLYELLTGSPPFSRAELLDSGLNGISQIIRERPPERPSTKLRKLTSAKEASSENSSHQDRLSRDLDWIILKCLEKDRTRRYGAVLGLEDDLKRHLDGEPIAARPPSILYKIQTTWRRHKWSISGAACVLISLVLGLGVSLWKTSVAEKQTREANGAKRQAKEEEAKALKAYRDGLRIEYAHQMALVNEAIEKQSFSFASKNLAAYNQDVFKRSLRGWEWRYLQVRSSVGNPIVQVEGNIKDLAVSYDQKYLIAASNLVPGLHLFDLSTKQSLNRLLPNFKPNKIISHPKRNIVATAGQYSNGTNMVNLVDLDSGDILRQYSSHLCEGMEYWEKEDMVVCLEYTGSGQQHDFSGHNVLSFYPFDDSRSTKTFDLEGRSTFWPYWNPFALSPDDPYAAYAAEDGNIYCVDLSDGKIIWKRQIEFSDNQQKLARSMFFSHDGNSLIVSWNHKIVELDTRSGTLLRELNDGSAKGDLLLLPNKQQFLSTWNQSLHLWNQDGNAPIYHYGVNDEKIQVLAKTHHRDSIVMGTQSGNVYLISPSDLEAQKTHRSIEGTFAAWSFNLRGDRIMTASRDGKVTRWNPKKPQEPQPILQLQNVDMSLGYYGEDFMSFSPGGTHLARSSHATKRISIYRTSDGALIEEFDAPFDRLASIHLTKDAKELRIEAWKPNHEDTEIIIHSIGNNAQPPKVIKGGTNWLWGRSEKGYFTPYGNWLLVNQMSPEGMDGYRLLLYQTNPWKHITTYDRQEAGNLWHPSFDAHQSKLFLEGTFLSLPDLKEERSIELMALTMASMFFDDDSRMAIQVGEDTDYEVQIWDTTSYLRLIKLKSMQKVLRNPELKYSPNGEILAMRGEEMIEFWIAPSEGSFENWETEHQPSDAVAKTDNQ